MLGHEILGFLLPWHQAVLVENHLHAFFPQLPRIRRHVLVDALPQLTGPRRVVETRQVFLEFDAEDFSAALVAGRRFRRRGMSAGVSHAGIVPLAIPGRWRTATARAPGEARVRRRRATVRARK